jgi:hypothetical protein
MNPATPAKRYCLESYRAIIQTALASGYRFVPFGSEYSGSDSVIYLRHDVDYSLSMALELARINAELGVQGTFCILLRSQVYNALSEWSRNLTVQIHKLGQHIAMHATAERLAIDDLESDLRSEFEFTRRSLPMLGPVFSWHNPSPELLELCSSMNEMAGLTNIYATRYTRDINYLSDSNLRHSVDAFLRAVSSGEKTPLHLLLHPFNWVAGGDNMREVFTGTWQTVIREREQEFRLNRSYQEMLPDGMPQAVLQGFAEQWSRAAGRKADDS